MKFHRVIGKIDPNLVVKAEEKLSSIFLELGTKTTNEHVGTQLGGDPVIFSLMYPVQHICTNNIPTAATDGRKFYWNPNFVLKQSKIGLRLIAGHEAWHALYMHPDRRGSRLPKLWNIAVDYIVNGAVMDDLKSRRKDPSSMFEQHLGKYMTLSQYAEMLKDPFKPIKGINDDIEVESYENPDVKLPKPEEDRELTAEEIQELERREKKVRFYFADPALEDEMKRPEKIYEYLYNLLPKCPDCGRVGYYSRPKDKNDKNNNGSKNKNDKGSDKDKQDKKDGKGNKKDKKKGQQNSNQDQNHEHGDGENCDCKDHGNQPDGSNGVGDQQDPNGKSGGCDHGGCSTCGDGIDIFGLGGTVDEHMDTQESQEKMAKRISDAIETAKKMAGHVPAALEIELGILTAPKVTWQDVVRGQLIRARQGNDRNDWTRFKSRPLFSGLLTPKRKTYHAKFGVLLDTSGSMSKDDKAYGLSQLQGLDEKGEGVLVFADAEIYWDQKVELKRCNSETLSRLKPVGGGGTVYSGFFTDYEKHFGKCDFLIVLSDMYLDMTDVANMVNPGIPVYWISTSAATFEPPFGRALDLRA